jgi:hypothetical protein
VQAGGFGDGRQGDVADPAAVGGQGAGGLKEVLGAAEFGLMRAGSAVHAPTVTL